MERLRPTAKQAAWQDLEVGLFVHFGINTFADLEWSDGTEDPGLFNPTDFDPNQWAEAARDAGMRYLVITAKHHDGFCLWPTATTDYGVVSSPWLSGKGDVIEAVAEACREHGLKLGIYCSPWDRHEPCYPDEKAYDRFYLAQWRELLTRYGEVMEAWFDGAGSQDHQFDWDAIFGQVYELQPDALCFNGPDLRWVGNEDGLAPDPCWNAAEWQGETVWRPAECDVPLRKGWFWHPNDEATRKPLPHLWDIYHRSVGHGTNLLLNVAPDRTGRLPKSDVAALRAWREALDACYAEDLAPTASAVAGDTGHGQPHYVIDGRPDTWWQATAATGAWIELRLPQAVEIDRAVLAEWLPEGERVRRWRLLAGDRELASGESVGHKKITRFEPCRVDSVRLVIDDAAAPPCLRQFALFRGTDPQ